MISKEEFVKIQTNFTKEGSAALHDYLKEESCPYHEFFKENYSNKKEMWFAFCDFKDINELVENEIEMNNYNLNEITIEKIKEVADIIEFDGGVIMCFLNVPERTEEQKQEQKAKDHQAYMDLYNHMNR